MSKVSILWFRNGLRLHDNGSLLKATEEGQVSMLYSSVLWSRSQTFLLEPEPDKKAPALVPGCCRVT